jgi:hypothetical protein
MSDEFYKLYLAITYTLALGAAIYFSKSYINAVIANANSQNRAAWAQVYWTRRGQLLVEKDMCSVDYE